MQINRQYDDSFANAGAKIGTTLRIRLPVQYVTSTGPNLNLQNTVETNVALPIVNQHSTSTSSFASRRTHWLTIDDFSARYIEPKRSPCWPRQSRPLPSA